MYVPCLTYNNKVSKPDLYIEFAYAEKGCKVHYYVWAYSRRRRQHGIEWAMSLHSSSWFSATFDFFENLTRLLYILLGI